MVIASLLLLLLLMRLMLMLLMTKLCGVRDANAMLVRTRL